MICYVQILFIFELFAYVLTESNIIVERWINATDVIRRVPFETMTSCYMGCSRTVGRKTIGFEENPAKVRNAYCKLLKTIGKAKSSSNVEHMYLLLKVSDLQEEKSKQEILKRIKIVDKQIVIKKKNLITTLEKLTPQYVIYLEFKPTTYDRYAYRYVNVLKFTQHVAKWTHGSRLPMISFDDQNKGRFWIGTAVNGQWNYEQLTTKAYPVNTWISVKISQLKENGVYNYSFSVNNELVHSVINNKPELFKNVDVFVADDENPIQPGYVRKLWVDVEC